MTSITKISSKGQIVIPSEIREKLNIKEGNIFLVLDNKDSICLKKIDLPKIKSWNKVVQPFRDAAKKSKFTQQDLIRVIHETRLK